MNKTFFELHHNIIKELLEKSYHNDINGLNVACLFLNQNRILSYGYNNWIGGSKIQQFKIKGTHIVDNKQILVDDVDAVVYRQRIEKMKDTSITHSENNYLILRMDKRNLKDKDIYDLREHLKAHAETNALINKTVLDHRYHFLVNVIPCPNCSKLLFNKGSNILFGCYLFDWGNYPETWANVMHTSSLLIQSKIIMPSVQNKINMDSILKLTKRENNPDKSRLIEMKLLSGDQRSMIDVCFDTKDERLKDVNKERLVNELNLGKDIRFVDNVADYTRFTYFKRYNSLYLYIPNKLIDFIRNDYSVKKEDLI
jgi:deoxycytidylate deaminase